MHNRIAFVAFMHAVAQLLRQRPYHFWLIALVALLVSQPFAAVFGVGESLFDVLFAAVLVVLVLTLALDRAWRVVASMLCIPAVLLIIGGHVLPSTAQNMILTAGHAIGALFFVAVTGKIVHSLFASQELSLDSIFGAICGYLLLGVAWALIYAMIHHANSQSFRFDEAIAPQMEHAEFSRNVFIYYSFVTLTTVGYGDVTPLSIPARTLSWVEAVTGQLYLAVLIAGLIGALVAKNKAGQERIGAEPRSMPK